MKTIMPKQLKNEERKWYLIDANWQNLWRLSTKVATILKWKEKPDFSPHLDNWDYVVIINADKIATTWNKLDWKVYYSHTGFLWGLKEITLGKLLTKKPTEVLKKSVSGMLPKNRLRKEMLSRLKLTTWDQHTFAAQKPEQINL